ncbi:MAG TPA: LPP20 family lipoprotein [bacterium]|nr:LPP20 family lipoprotein [bacterium]
MRRSIALSLLILLPALLFAKKEAWADDPRKLYPESRFLAAVGSGDTLAAAQQRAAAALAAMIKVTVKGDLELTTRYDELKKGGVVTASTEKTAMTDSTRQTTDQELIGLSYGETCTDDMGKTYAIAYLDRAKSAAVYKELVDADSAVVTRFLKSADAGKEPLKRYAFLSAAAATAANSARLMGQLLVINKSAYQSAALPYRADEVRTQYRAAAEAMPFAVVWKGAPDEKITGIVTEALTAAGYAVGQKGAVTIGASLLFEKVELNNKYYNLKWDITLTVAGADGVAIATVKESARSSALSESDAKNRSYIDMKKVIQKKLPAALSGYFLGVLK